MPHDQTLTHPIDKQTGSRPVPASSDIDPEVSDESSLDASSSPLIELHEADVRQTLGAMGLVCRSVLACLLALALALGLAATLTLLLLP